MLCCNGRNARTTIANGGVSVERPLVARGALLAARSPTHALSPACERARSRVGPQAAVEKQMASRTVACAAAGDADLVVAGPLYLGCDFGTSGARATLIDDAGNIISEAKETYGEDAEADWATAWESALWRLIASFPSDDLARVAAIAFDGTSATAMLVDRVTGEQLAPPKLYSEAQPAESVAAAMAIAPKGHTATASTSTLSKVLTWNAEGVWQAAQARGADPGLLHQADWLASLLTGDRSLSDWNNALKLGFEPAPGACGYPEWLASQPYAGLFPADVISPGAPGPRITKDVAERTGLPPHARVCGGTTDSIAAFLAADVTRPGEAVTSLGSTLAIKLVSDTRVDDADHGIYSHRLGDVWLVGGASNTGGAVLRQHFADFELKALTEQIDVTKPTGLTYYPLTKKGERFPVNDPEMQPLLTPRPASDAMFLQGMLEGIAKVEGSAFKLLADMGASPVTRVLTAGGGAVNEKWTAIRSAEIGVEVAPAANGEASYGAALLARMGGRASSE